MYARYKLSGESQFVEAKQTVGKDYGVFLGGSGVRCGKDYGAYRCICCC
jgi:hypothetical protein